MISNSRQQQETYLDSETDDFSFYDAEFTTLFQRHHSSGDERDSELESGPKLLQNKWTDKPSDGGNNDNRRRSQLTSISSRRYSQESISTQASYKPEIRLKTGGNPFAFLGAV
jgi:hypothetical protein